ncbi:MAG: hypothetical protein EP330_08865 [Deltaproteobacteria bacterium]|nr:MAG: hypothetical protein EP330_08865 [Deltaproteobacteria bacterium]
MLTLLALAAFAGPDGYMPDRDFDLLHLDLALTVDPAAGTVEGTATHRVAPLGKPSTELVLQQQALDIREVRVDGEPASFDLGTGVVRVRMPADGKAHEVALDYAAQPELGLHFRAPGRDSSDTVVEVWSQGQDNDNQYWIPSWDYPNDRFTYSAAFTVPEQLVVATNGARLDSAPAERAGFKTERFALEQELPTYLIALVVGDYAVYTEVSDGVDLEYLVASTVPEDEARTAGGFAAPQMAYFNELLGTRYAWPVYRQAFVQRFMYGGMENTSLTINMDGVIGLTEKDKERAEGLVAHELAHQWFGDLVTCYGWRDRWLNEGFATMYASRWTEHAHGRAFYDAQVVERMASASAYGTPMARRSWSPEGPDSTGVYDRGMMVLHMLRTHLGDEIYDAGIRLYLERHAHQFVESGDLRRALEDVSGEHLGWLFDRWVHDAGVPELSTRWKYKEGQLVVEIDQGEKVWPAPVEIEIGTAEDTLTRTVWADEQHTRLVLDLPDRPAYVAVDPRGGVLAKWQHEQSPEAWVAQAKLSPSPYAQLVAFAKIAETRATPEALDALRTAMRGDAHPKFRSRAVEALGKLATEEAAEIVITALDDEDERMRAAAASALGEASATSVARKGLERALADEHGLVQGAALTAYAKLDATSALGVARRAVLGQDGSGRKWLHTAAIGVLRDHGDASDLPRLQRHLSGKSPSFVLRQATSATAKLLGDLEGKAEDKARDKASRALEALLYDSDFQTRRIAASSLGNIGDERAHSALLALAAETAVPRLRDVARDAATRIHQRPGDKPEAPSEAEDPEVLEQRLDELEERLRKLEERR